MRALIGLGGNIGDPVLAMSRALDLLDSHAAITVLSVSSLYRTPPWGKIDQPDFFNACANLATGLGPVDLLEMCLHTEVQLKRVRRERWGPRTIDIDLLWHSRGPIDVRGLTLPHPRMFERVFVLLPLSEIAGDLSLEGKTVNEWAHDIKSARHTVVSGPDWWTKQT